MTSVAPPALGSGPRRGQEFTMTIQSVKVNEEIPADRFEPPAEIKTLLQKAAAPTVKK